MPIIRNDDEERLARVDHMLDVVKKRREELSETVRDGERVCERSSSTGDRARAATDRPDTKAS